jgi:hypothetical protein
VEQPVYIIGIDLGTTNSVVAYTRAGEKTEEGSEIKILDIPQLTAPHTIEKQSSLPSFIYMPAKGEAGGDAFFLPWDSDGLMVIGEYAKNRAPEVPQRVISSSKSWLCNTSVDRNEPVLPWEAPGDVKRISPVAASSALLAYLRNAWNYEMANGDQKLFMENQEIYLTVPASFDAVARQLTVEAAKLAGLQRVTLLEEPQAAFYSWINMSGEKWRRAVKKGELVLICDVGGGTTDFSLIEVAEEKGELVLERVAVGEHLLVGGDNMDLALSYHVASKMAEKGTRLDSWQMRSMVHACRSAKEGALAGADNRQAWPVTILGRGSGLIANTLKTDLPAEDIKQVVTEGFFPPCRADENPVSRPRTGLQEAGLVYASDPAVTRHLAAFLANRGQGDNRLSAAVPDAILFNGGVMKSPIIRKRVRQVIDSWGDGQEGVRELNTDNYDLAVARGAAGYGLARLGRGIRIRAGLNKSYYIGIAAAMPAVPGMPQPVKALCVAPFGMEEGTKELITKKEFVLVVGEPVIFDFFGSARRQDDKAGDVVEDWQGQIEEITTMETTLDGEAGSVVRVTLEAVATETGTLELWCVAAEEGRRWKLEFNVRHQD